MTGSLLLLVGTALAAPFRFSPTPGAVAELLPAVEPGRAEILVRGNHADLRSQLGQGGREGIRAWRVTDLGESWAIVVWLEDPADAFSLRRDGDAWTGTVARADGAPLSAMQTGPAASLDALLALSADAGRCDVAPASPLVPLHGSDMLHAFAPTEFTVELPRWTEAEPASASWEAVVELRSSLALARTPAERAIRLYALGAAHRDLGHDREAAYYFERAQAAGAPEGTAAMQRAGALLRSRQWERAREAARKAVASGAPEDTALETVALTVLQGGGAAAPFARALAAHTTRPQAQLIAGALLMRAGCHPEASVILRRAQAVQDPVQADMARILLADALVLLGESRGAAELLASFDGDVAPRWRPAMRARSRLLSMLASTPDQWPTFVPGLTKAADRWDVEGSEALYLLGQVGAALGDSRMANDNLASLIDRDRRLAGGGPGRRLLVAWQARLTELLDAGRAVDALSFHGGTWRAALLAHLTDPAPLRLVARAYRDAGLYQPALSTLSDVASVEGALGLDERETTLAIADVYRRTGRLSEAIEALNYLARRSGDPSITPRAELLLARTQADADEIGAARASYLRLARGRAPLPVRAEARLRLALLDARTGRCEAALPSLLPASLPDDVSPGLLGVTRARCLVAVGRLDEGRAAASAASPLLTDPEVRAWADFLAEVGVTGPRAEPAEPVVAAEVGPDGKPVTPPPEPPGKVWRWLADEERAHAALRERVTATIAPRRSSAP